MASEKDAADQKAPKRNLPYDYPIRTYELEMTSASDGTAYRVQDLIYLSREDSHFCKW